MSEEKTQTQELREKLMNEEEGTLVPFNIFYDALEKFIDHTHSSVITKAGNNGNLMSFDVEVLKVLFLIKYVKEIKSNIENITTLMIDNILADKIALREKVVVFNFEDEMEGYLDIEVPNEKIAQFLTDYGRQLLQLQ